MSPLTQRAKNPMITPSARPKCGWAELLAGSNEGLTYSPLFRLTLNASVAMPLIKHGAGQFTVAWGG
jgi:hypothetical protein